MENNMLAWYTKSYADGSPRGKIHQYVQDWGKCLCGKELINDGMWMLSANDNKQVTCKECLEYIDIVDKLCSIEEQFIVPNETTISLG